MITKMKKLAFLVYHKEYDAFLTGLRNLGVVHISEQQSGVPDSPELQDNLRLHTRLAATLKLLQNIKSEAKFGPENTTATRGLHAVEEADALLSEKNKLTGQLQACLKDEKTLQPWGDFDLDCIQKLRDAGVNINFYSCSEGNYNAAWEEECRATIITRESSKLYFITVTQAGEPAPELGAEQIKLPPYSLAYVQNLHASTKKALKEANLHLSELAARDIPAVQAAMRELQNNMEFSKVLLGTEKAAGEKLMLLQGWIPAAKEPEIRTYLNAQSLYYEIADPAPEDNVPIQLRNIELFAWFEPICKLYMLPKYNELDLTPFFAPFFMLFFGLCLGDIGYGLFMLLGITAYRMTAKNIGSTLKPILSLMQVLMGSTLFCGLLTGTFFGFSIYDLNWPWIQYLKSAVLMDNDGMFQLSLILGVVQIIFGMMLKVVNQTIQVGFKYAIGTIGWILLLLSVAFAKMLPDVMPLGETVHLVVMGIAGVMIFLYNNPDKNIFINIGLGFWDTYNMATGLLGDVLSYIRLFALGLSGGILAGVFNSLAVGISPDNIIFGPLFMVLIFVIGHSVNMFMNVLGAIVHPMRLTFVEFFKNSGYEGGGKEYRPFVKL